MVNWSKQRITRIEPGGVKKPWHEKLLGSEKGFSGPVDPGAFLAVTFLAAMLALTEARGAPASENPLLLGADFG
jgi:hypothetical protein